jgi:hypothetical protein
MEAEAQEQNGTNGHDDSRAGRPSLAVLLNEAGLASSERVQSALAEGMKTGEKLGEVLIRQGAVSDEQLAQLLAKQWELPYVRADALTVDPFALRRLSAADARELGALAVRFEQSEGSGEDGQLTVAIAEPSEERFAAIAGAVGETDVCYEVVAHSTLERLLRSRLTGGETEEVPAPAAAPAKAAADHPPHPDLNEVAESLEDAAGRLRSLQSGVDTLRSALRLAEKQIDDYERRLADAERDREKLRRVEDELARREEYIETLRGKVGELHDALASP